MAKKRKRIRQTSDRVSTIAGTVLAHMKGIDLKTPLTILGCSLRELKALAASALNQDQHRGKRKRARRRK